jgi:hypothetical protein
MVINIIPIVDSRLAIIVHTIIVKEQENIKKDMSVSSLNLSKFIAINI